MDCIQYVNSKDIRQYLYDTDYKLSLDQSIFIICNCRFISIEQKIDALILLKSCSEDIPLSSIGKDSYYSDLSGVSAHEFIDGLIGSLNRNIRLLTEESAECFYKVEALYAALRGSCEYSDYAYFRTYKQCLEAIKNDPESFDDCISIKIRKQRFSAKRTFECEAFLTKDLKLMDVSSSDSIQYECAQFISLPMPFKQGDLIKRRIYPKTELFLNKSVFMGYRPSKSEDYRSHRDGSDILYFGYVATAEGFELTDGSPFLYDLEYLSPDPADTEDRKLVLISKFIKGEIGLDIFYNEMKYLDEKSHLASLKAITNFDYFTF